MCKIHPPAKARLRVETRLYETLRQV